MDLIQVGIRLEDEDNVEELFKTPNEMRAIIMRQWRNSSIIRNVMIGADINGDTAEDRYTRLAYFALINLETTHQRLMEYVIRDPMPPIILKAR